MTTTASPTPWTRAGRRGSDGLVDLLAPLRFVPLGGASRSRRWLSRQGSTSRSTPASAKLGRQAQGVAPGARGVSRSVAMTMTGHKTEAVYRRYAIVSEQDLRDAAQKVAAAEQGRVTELGKVWGQLAAVAGSARRVTMRYSTHARVAKLADALDLGSSGATHGSSSLPSRTNYL